jgi:hypothetical protein
VTPQSEDTQHERPSFTMDPQRTHVLQCHGASLRVSGRPPSRPDQSPGRPASRVLRPLPYLYETDRSRVLCASEPPQALSLAIESSSPTRAVCGATRQLEGPFLGIGFPSRTAHRRELIIHTGELHYEMDSSDTSEKCHVRIRRLGRLRGSSEEVNRQR